jgi:hypothetical protein
LHPEAVRKAIVAALLRIVETDPAMGRHLHEHVRTGTTSCYQPPSGPPVHWMMSI